MKTDANSTSRQDVYTRITSQIVASLERGVRPWARPRNVLEDNFRSRTQVDMMK